MNFEKESSDEEEELNFHPPKDKDEEREILKRQQTYENVRQIIKGLKEGQEGKVLWDEVRTILLSNEKRLF